MILHFITTKDFSIPKHSLSFFLVTLTFLLWWNWISFKLQFCSPVHWFGSPVFWFGSPVFWFVSPVRWFGSFVHRFLPNKTFQTPVIVSCGIICNACNPLQSWFIMECLILRIYLKAL